MPYDTKMTIGFWIEHSATWVSAHVGPPGGPALFSARTPATGDLARDCSEAHGELVHLLARVAEAAQSHTEELVVSTLNHSTLYS